MLLNGNAESLPEKRRGALFHQSMHGLQRLVSAQNTQLTNVVG